MAGLLNLFSLTADLKRIGSNHDCRQKDKDKEFDISWSVLAKALYNFNKTVGILLIDSISNGFYCKFP